MKKSILSAAVCLMMVSTFARAGLSVPEWETEVRKMDQAYWNAYNQCDVKAMDQLNADEFEFYHDAGGVMKGKASFNAAMQKNICGNPQHKVRREALADTVRVYPMREGGKLYGALISGEHQFYNTENGGKEQIGARARFTHLLSLSNGAWKVSRVLSFDHTNTQYGNKQVMQNMKPAQFARVGGRYLAKGGAVVTVKNEGNQLALITGESSFILYPQDKETFFMKDRDVSVWFAPDDTGRVGKLVVREGGTVVEEAIRQD